MIERHIEYLTPEKPVACQRNDVYQCDPKTNGELWECQTLTSHLLDQCANQVDVLLWWFKRMEDEQR